MDLNLIDALQWVRSRPGQFLSASGPAATSLLTYVVADIVDLSAGDCVIRRAAGWWMVGSTEDWLAGSGLPIAQLFARVVAAPVHGVHSMRGEVIVAAFARDVAVRSAGTRHQICGAPPPEDVWDLAADLRAAIFFAGLTTAHAAAGGPDDPRSGAREPGGERP